MTITDTTLSTTRPSLRPVSFDLYRDIHKAVRVELFNAVADAGRLDVSDRNARTAVIEQVTALVTFLRHHAEHEDNAINAPLEQAAPELVTRILTEHEILEAGMDRLIDLVEQLRTAVAGDARAIAHELYLELAAFTGDYLLHQDVEERLVGPALDEALGFDGLLQLHDSILASIPPQQLSADLALMLVAMNVDDRTEMFGGMKAGAPAEVFEANWSLARSVLTADETKALASRLGLS